MKDDNSLKGNKSLEMIASGDQNIGRRALWKDISEEVKWTMGEASLTLAGLGMYAFGEGHYKTVGLMFAGISFLGGLMHACSKMEVIDRLREYQQNPMAYVQKYHC